MANVTLKIIDNGVCSDFSVITTNISKALVLNGLCTKTMPHIKNIECKSANEQVCLQAATRHCMYEASSRNIVTVVVCESETNSNNNLKRKRSPDLPSLAYVVIAPIVQ